MTADARAGINTLDDLHEDYRTLTGSFPEHPVEEWRSTYNDETDDPIGRILRSAHDDPDWIVLDTWSHERVARALSRNLRVMLLWHHRDSDEYALTVRRKPFEYRNFYKLSDSPSMSPGNILPNVPDPFFQEEMVHCGYKRILCAIRKEDYEDSKEPISQSNLHEPWPSVRCFASTRHPTDDGHDGLYRALDENNMDLMLVPLKTIREIYADYRLE